MRWNIFFFKLTKLKELKGEHRAKDELMSLEETSVHPSENHDSDFGNKKLDPIIDVFACICSLDGLVKIVDECVKRILIHVFEET